MAIGVAACGPALQKPLPRLPPASLAVPVKFQFSERALQARLSTIASDLPIDHNFGEFSWGNGRCSGNVSLFNTEERLDVNVQHYNDLFINVMKKHGYPVDDRIELFKDSKERVADLLVGARVFGALVNECYPNISQNYRQVRGNAYLKIEWSIYSVLEKKVVLTVTTEGATAEVVDSSIGRTGLWRPAFADALERLAVDAGYRRIIDSPKAGGPGPSSAARIKVRRARQFTGDLAGNIEAIKKAVATVTANKGSGSGFAIGDALVLTAEHVVSGSKYVKVNTAEGQECYGEVVASNKRRDLALIRVDCSGLSPLPLTRNKAVEGNDVFAIGTPLSQKLEFSVTKGVVSGIRNIDELAYIQSDVTVLPGSSGGPLLDSSGNAVAMTTAGLTANSVPIGVSFFIPLTDLEKYLPIDFE